MIIKIYFKSKNGDKTDMIIPFNNQSEMNSYIYRTLGDNNKFHDSFSEYSISSIQGGKKYDNKHIIFNEEPYIVVASKNEEFLTTLLTNIELRKYSFFNLIYSRCEFNTFPLKPEYDMILTISPILLKVNNRKITIDNPNYINFLKEHCIKKLKHCNIDDDTFDIKFRHFEKAKKKMIMVGKTFNVATMASFYVFGKKKTRETLYHMGLGGSTGSGFGSIKVYE